MDRREFLPIAFGTAIVVITTMVAFPLAAQIPVTTPIKKKLITKLMNNTITRQSQLPVKETMDKLEAILKQKNITIYARIDQQAEAAKAGIKLNGLEFILFGNPQKGGLVMAENPEAALDLPLKVIVWEDTQHLTWVTYNDTEGIRQRFSLNAETAQLVDIDPLIIALVKG